MPRVGFYEQRKNRQRRNCEVTRKFLNFMLPFNLFLFASINGYCRNAWSNPVPHWMRVVFLRTLPKYLFIKPPDQEMLLEDNGSDSGKWLFLLSCLEGTEGWGNKASDRKSMAYFWFALLYA